MPDWKVPAHEASEATKLGWITEAIQQGEAFLKAQRAYSEYDVAIDIIAGASREKLADYRSKVRGGRLKRNIREHIATLADLRPFWGYTTENRDLYTHAMVLNKLLFAWYQNTFADRSVRKGLQWAAVQGAGFLSPVFRPDDWTVGRGDVYLQDYGPKDCLVIQPTKDNNHQRAYAVAIRNEVPIFAAHKTYPNHAHLIKPDREAPSTVQRGMQKVQRFLSPVLNMFSGTGGSKESSPAIFPTVDIWHIYVQDDAVNMTGRDVMMGQPGTSWCYTVPSYKSQIPDGNNSDGSPRTRAAGVDDARLYPLRRLIIATSSCTLYDDTSHYWHGKVPLIKFQMDDWPWEPNGYSMVRDAYEIEKSIDKTLRSIDDTINAKSAPALAYDQQSVPKATAERLDTRRPGTKVGMNMQMGEGFKPLLPPEYYHVAPEQFNHITAQEQRMDYMMGVRDFTALAKGRTSTNPDSMERLMEMAGPLVKDESRGMESQLKDLGEMMKSNFFQFYTSARKLQILGEGAITPEDFDYEPGNMVPSHMPNENKEKPSNSTAADRARYWAMQFAFSITPNSLHQITQTSRKLMYLQLQRDGFPLDPWTIAQIFDIPNFGAAPEGANTIMERWMAWKDIEMEQQLEMQEKLQAAANGGIMGGDGGGQPITPPAGGSPRDHSAGRKPSGQQTPRLASKDGGSRQTIAESR